MMQMMMVMVMIKVLPNKSFILPLGHPLSLPIRHQPVRTRINFYKLQASKATKSEKGIVTWDEANCIR